MMNHPTEPEAPDTESNTDIPSDQATDDPTVPPEPKPNNLQPVGSVSGGWMKKLWLVLGLIILVAASYFGYKHYIAKPAKPKAAVKRDIPLIRFGTLNGPVNVFYPSEKIAVISGEEFVNYQIFEGLVGWQGGSKLVPRLATSWTNPDDSTWLFNLRPNVKFHTGNPMTATDVKYSLDHFKDITYSGAYGGTIKSVEAVSPTQVKITTDGPDPLLLNRLANLFIVDSKGTKPNDPVNGTGPYQLKPGTDPSKDSFTDLVAFDGYWGGHVYTRELQFSQIINEPDQVAALKGHKIDVFDNFVDNDSLNQLKSAGIRTISQVSYNVDQIGFNTQRAGSPLGSLKFRQALNVGTDRDALIKALGVNGIPTGQYVVAEVPGFVPKIKAPTQDITQAKTLIEQSGMKNKTLTLSYGTDSSTLSMLTELQKEWAALGVTLKLDAIDNLDDVISKFQDGKTDMFFASNISILVDASDVLSVFQLPGVYDNPAADDALAKANQTLDGAKHLALLQQAAQIYSDDVSGLPLFTRSEYFAQTSSDYTLTPEIPGIDASAYFWQVYQK